MPKFTAVVLVALTFVALRTADGGDCLPFLNQMAAIARAGNLGLNMVTLNNKGVASWTGLAGSPGAGGGGGTTVPLTLTLVPGQTVRGVERPAILTTPFGLDVGRPKQLFSDRIAGPQPFNLGQSDDVAIEIPVVSGPEVTVTLKSWNDAQAKFAGSCEAGGFVLGSTPDVKYILHLQQIAR
jgi:hypothetical protein